MISHSMDTSVAPCDDFYKFTCGNWASEFSDETKQLMSYNKFLKLQFAIYDDLQKAFEKKLKESNLPSAQSKVIDIYKSCLNKNNKTALIMEIWNLLDEIGGWPIGNTSWKEDEYDIDINTAIAIKKTGVSPLLTFGILPDPTNTTRNIIAVSHPDMLQDGLNDSDILQFFWTVAVASPSFSFFTFLRDMNDLLSLEKELQDIVHSHQPSTDITKHKIKDLNIEGVDIIEFLQVITNSSLNTMEEFLTEEDEIATNNLPYLQNLATLVQSNKYPLRTYANYIGARIILEAAALVFSVTSTPDCSYPKKSLIYSRSTENITPCLNILSKKLNYVTDRIYVDYVGDHSVANEKGMKMLNYIRKAFEILAEDSNWLDNDTFVAAKEKLEVMKNHVGYPDWILDDEKLNTYYNMLPNMDPSFPANIKKISAFVMDKQLRKLRELNNLDEWPNLPGLTITDVNAFYVGPFNGIVLPLAIQNIPFYDPAIPWYLNFGAIGAIIGHEITHGFDSDGRLLDKYGNKNNWWSAEAEKNFNERADCFVNQYNSYFFSEVNLTVNGTLTLAENIADNGGLRQAYLAYKTWEEEFGNEEPLPGLEQYTSDQLFFIAYGSLWCATYTNMELELDLRKDPHTPSPFRVWGTISNSKEFADVFKCDNSTKMNPEKKCIIW